ncbi:MAG: glycosyltransferase family 2 protein [Candidatus Limnocylindrales bacterium]
MRITIVTPSFNQAKYLEGTLRSVLDQHYPDLELIVNDGGSTDASADILDRYSSRLSYVQTCPDSGQTDALIQGFKRATGDILAWLNSDDLHEANTLAEVATHFESNPDDRFVFGDSTWIDADGPVLHRQREMPFVRWIWLRTYNYIPQPSAFWRRGLYEEVGGLDPAYELAMDTDLFARFAERTRPRHVSRFWSRMRSHPDQKNVRLRSRSDQEDERIRARYRVPGGGRGEVERLLAKTARVAYRAASGAYWSY